MKFVFYLISNHIFGVSIIRIYVNLIKKGYAQRIIEFTDEKLKPKVLFEDRFINQ